jgi:hypothetical protein
VQGRATQVKWGRVGEGGGACRKIDGGRHGVAERGRAKQAASKRWECRPEKLGRLVDAGRQVGRRRHKQAVKQREDGDKTLG